MMRRIDFQITDIDVRDQFEITSDRVSVEAKTCCKVLLAGSTLDGTQVLVIVTGFRPWAYVTSSNENIIRVENFDDEEKRKQFHNYGKYIMKQTLELKPTQEPNPMWNPLIEIESHKYLYGWRPSARNQNENGLPEPAEFLFWKYTFPRESIRKKTASKFREPYLKNLSSGFGSKPSSVFLQNAIAVQNGAPFVVWADDMDITTQFLTLTGLQAEGWATLSIPEEDFQTMATSSMYTWHCPIEIHCDIRCIAPSTDESLSAKVAAKRIVSADIEVHGSTGNFPDASVSEDVITHIGATYQFYTDPDDLSKSKRIMFCLYETEPIPNVETRWYRSEPELLLGFRNWLMMEYGADIVLTYNGRKFDWKYMYDRAKMHGILAYFAQLSWLRTDECQAKPPKMTGSKQMGFHDTWQWKRTFGLFEMDVLQFIQKNFKLRSYSLNFVSKEFLEDEKDDLKPKEMFELFHTAEGRRRIGIYCAKDCDLPLRLLYKKRALVQEMEIARLTYTFLEPLQSRGQIKKITNMLHQRCYEKGYVPSYCLTDANKYTILGATVLPPKAGFYTRPVTTMDFASLYPSIMRAHNLCLSTFLDPENPNSSNGEECSKDYVGSHYVASRAGGKKPETHRFVKHYSGLLPSMLTDLINARTHVKTLIKTASDQATKDVYDVRQLALKVVANSIYGFSCASANPYSCVAIGESVTMNGRKMIEATQNYILTKFTKERIYNEILKIPVPPELDNKSVEIDILYGDTDSVMIHLPFLANQTGLEQAFVLGPLMAREITNTLFIRPIDLTFEKVFFPFCLFRKKRYVGYKYLSLKVDDKNPSIDKKGLENVRRDTLPFTVRILNGLQSNLIERINPEGALEVFHREMDALLRGELPIEDFILSKGLNKEYKDPKKMVHLAVVEKMFQRNPGSQPKIGDRVPYVILFDGTIYSPQRKKKVLLSEKSEDPVYAKEHGLQLDYLYYLHHGIRKPITNFLKAFYPAIDREFERYIAQLEAKIIGNRSISSYFQVESSSSSSAATTTAMDTTPMMKKATMISTSSAAPKRAKKDQTSMLAYFS
jgi:DNA polymerase delta subunit 1